LYIKYSGGQRYICIYLCKCQVCELIELFLRFESIGTPDGPCWNGERKYKWLRVIDKCHSALYVERRVLGIRRFWLFYWWVSFILVMGRKVSNHSERYVSWKWKKEGKKKTSSYWHFSFRLLSRIDGVLHMCSFVVLFPFMSIVVYMMTSSFLFCHHLQRHEYERNATFTRYGIWTARSLSIVILTRIVLNEICYTVAFHTATKNYLCIVDYYQIHMAHENVQSLFR
jgi:hypothetical protein